MRKNGFLRSIAYLVGGLLIFLSINASTPAVAEPFTQKKAPLNSSTTPTAHSGVEWAHPEIPRIAAKDVKQLLSNKADIVIVDTQPSDGYDLWHIPTAVNIPYSLTVDPTNRELMLIALPMDKLIVIYCLCEEGTDSARMALELRSLGYSEDKVKVLEGGLIKWDELGYPLLKQQTFR